MTAFRFISLLIGQLFLIVPLSAHATITDNQQAAQLESIRLLVLKNDFAKLKMLLDRNQEALGQAVNSNNNDLNVDLRNRTLIDDLRDYLISKDDQLQIGTITTTFEKSVALRNVDNAASQMNALRSILDTAPYREDAIKAYWSAITDVDREHRLWRRALEIDGLPADTPHDASVIAAETNFRDILARDTILKDSWKPLLKDLVPALIADRNTLTRRVATDLSRSVAVKYFANTAVVLPSPNVTVGNQSLADKNQQVNIITTTSAITSTEPAISTRKFTQAKLKQPIPNLDDYFPASCKRKGEEGVVILSIKVDRNGKPTYAGIIASSGSEALDGAALSFYEKLQFYPATRDGDVVETIIKLPVNFRLASQPSSK